jgi:hypothetical protein
MFLLGDSIARLERTVNCDKYETLSYQLTKSYTKTSSHLTH